MRRKKSGDELSKGPKNEIINKFLKTELERLEQKLQLFSPKTKDPQRLDQLFQDILNEVW